jgi:hypothetical protein
MYPLCLTRLFRLDGGVKTAVHVGRKPEVVTPAGLQSSGARLHTLCGWISNVVPASMHCAAIALLESVVLG